MRHLFKDKFDIYHLTTVTDLLLKNRTIIFKRVKFHYVHHTAGMCK